MKSLPTRLAVATALSLCAAACTTAPAANPVGTNADMRTSPWHEPQTQASDPGVLYARNGTVVSGPDSGSVVVKDGQANREVGADSGSRMYLLERFQETVEENEALQFEIQGLSAALDQSEALSAQLQKDLDELQARFLDSEGRVEKLEADNIALAEHLTTAQIRRLQAEKLLIEAKIDWQRVQRMTETAPTTELPEETSTGRTDPGKVIE